MKLLYALGRTIIGGYESEISVQYPWDTDLSGFRGDLNMGRSATG